MPHLSGVLLIDCPASALNNAGTFLAMENPSKYQNWTSVKKVRTKEGVFPYVSAQAFRNWLRETLKFVEGWSPAPTYREQEVAYTDANPILYAEDDFFGYMRAPAGKGTAEIGAKRGEWKGKGLGDQETTKEGKDQKFVALTRVSPFKVSTLISLAPLNSSSIGYDYGNMARAEGDPVPFEHEFYRTTLVGLFSLDLRMIGRFYHVERTGFRHLDSIRKALAEERGLKAYDGGRAYELPLEDRKNRLRSLLKGLARVTGGAKLALHYTDVTPRFLMLGVAKGGNHLFGTAVSADSKGLPRINVKAIEEIARVYADELLSGFYVGLTQGYLDNQRVEVEEALKAIVAGQEERSFSLSHPVEAINALLSDLDKNAERWLA